MLSIRITVGPWTGNLIDNGVHYQWLEGGRRLHLQHGPIDLVIEANGHRDCVVRAYQQAHEVFQSTLTDLVAELDYLRQELTIDSCEPCGRVARRMYNAASLYTHLESVTPMIAVAGSVADHVLQAMLTGTSLERAYVNNGGDIALWLAPGCSFTIGICDNTETRTISTNLTLQAQQGVRGIATSGWRGRSHSLGIADAVTVLADSAADADAAATLIANAVDVPGSPNIHREPAISLSPDSDLGELPVTVAVDRLPAADVSRALERGRLKAEQLLSMQRVSAVYLHLMGSSIVCGSRHGTINQIPRAGVMHA